MSERALQERIRAGDEGAFDTVFRSHYAYLVRMAESVVRDRALAEEVAQEVMLELWRRRESLQLEQTFRAYLIRSTRNRALNHIRHQRVVAREAWLAMRPEDLLDAKFTVHPACALICSPYAIAEIWTAHQTNAAFPAEINSPTWALIVRPGGRPAILGQCAAAHAAFAALQRRATLNEALDAAFAINSGFDLTSQWRAWIEVAAIAGLAPRVHESKSTPELKP